MLKVFAFGPTFSFLSFSHETENAEQIMLKTLNKFLALIDNAKRFLVKKIESYAKSCDDYDLDGDEAFILLNERSS